MFPSSKLRNIEKKIATLEAKHKDYEGRLEAVNASTAGREKSRSESEKAAGLKEKMTFVKNEIRGCENEIKAMRYKGTGGILSWLHGCETGGNTPEDLAERLEYLGW